LFLSYSSQCLLFWSIDQLFSARGKSFEILDKEFFNNNNGAMISYQTAIEQMAFGKNDMG
jgi:hypothetical protein